MQVWHVHVNIKNVMLGGMQDVGVITKNMDVHEDTVWDEATRNKEKMSQ